MNKLSLFVGITLGLAFSIFVVVISLKVAAPSMLLKEVKSPYEFDKTVKILEDRLNAKEGWYVTDIIDQQDEIITHGKVKIIKFSNVSYVSEMLSADESKLMATKMPLSISVYEKTDGRVMIGLSNRSIMARLFSGRRDAKSSKRH